MRIGSSLVLIAIGAILKFAETTSVSGISLSTVGVVPMVGGGEGGSPAWSSRLFWPAPSGARTLCLTRQAGTTWIRRRVTTHAPDGVGLSNLRQGGMQWWLGRPGTTCGSAIRSCVAATGPACPR